MWINIVVYVNFFFTCTIYDRICQAIKNNYLNTMQHTYKNFQRIKHLSFVWTIHSLHPSQMIIIHRPSCQATTSFHQIEIFRFATHKQRSFELSKFFWTMHESITFCDIAPQTKISVVAVIFMFKKSFPLFRHWFDCPSWSSPLSSCWPPMIPFVLHQAVMRLECVQQNPLRKNSFVAKILES